MKSEMKNAAQEDMGEKIEKGENNAQSVAMEIDEKKNADQQDMGEKIEVI